MGKFAAPKEGGNAVVTDEAELQRHQQLERLNASTTNTKVSITLSLFCRVLSQKHSTQWTRVTILYALESNGCTNQE